MTDERPEFTVEGWNPLAEKNVRPAPKVERDDEGRLVYRVRSVPRSTGGDGPRQEERTEHTIDVSDLMVRPQADAPRREQQAARSGHEFIPDR